jgi:hypothetical protein
MAACDLRIELDEPRKVYAGGETISGAVLVKCEAPVKCNGLELTTYWGTHGRGNIASGDIDHQTLFQGEWDANQEYRYPFSLKIAAWPPTYYGTYLNVSHSVRARAKLPWKSDPQTEAEFTVVSLTAPEDLKPTVGTPKKSSLLGWIVGWIFGAILLLILIPLLGMLLVVLIPLAAIGGATYWFFRVFLPSQLTGSIECTVEPKRVAAGQTVQGQLRFTPKRNMSINGIQWTMACVEKCSSGSGSNRKTYSHDVLRQVQQLSGATQLRVGEPQAFNFSFSFPEDAPASLKFNDNELTWTCDLRIDIPKWPDWVKSIPVTVLPSGKSGTAPSRGMIAPGSTAIPTAEDEQWFTDVLEQVSRCENDQEINVVIDAVRDQIFTVCVNVIEHWDEPPAGFEGHAGQWIHTIPRRSDVEVALLWTLSGSPPNVETMNWCGQAVIVGYDRDMECLLMRVLPPS